MGRKIRIDMVGFRSGRLVGLAFVETRGGRAHWLFECDCGQTTVINGSAVRSGRTSSCGCLHREVSAARLTVHGHRAGKRHGPTYRAWQQVNGLKDVAVSPAWASDFEAFLADLGERPPGTILARLDQTGAFEAGNCGWTPVRSRAERALDAHRARRLGGGHLGPQAGGQDVQVLAERRVG